MQPRMRRSTRKTTIVGGPATLRSSLVFSSHDGKLKLEDLEAAELIGEGSYGVVHKMKEKSTGQSRVVKTVVRPEGWDDQRLKAEAQLLQSLDHPHVLRIFAWYEENDAVNIVMEHCSGGEFLYTVRAGRGRGEPVCEKWCAVAFRQAFEALVYVHSKAIVHKDLKSDNLLLLESTEENGKVFARLPHIVVCDLGMAEVCSRGIFGLGVGTCKEIAGTPITMSPEVWKGAAGPKCDVWSMGVVMFQTFSNKLPFSMLQQIDNFETARSMWLALHEKGPNWPDMSASRAAKQFCQQLLSFKEVSRPTALECLKARWILENGSDVLSEEEVKAVTHALTTWKDKNPWQRAMCLKLAVGCTCINSFSRVFSRFDTDQSGALNRSEVMLALQSLGIDKQSSKKIAQDLDVNGDNSCEYLEFAAACLSSLEDKFDELLRLQFMRLDTNQDGVVSGDEFRGLVDELTPVATEHGIRLERSDLDENNDGIISFSEFATYFGREGINYSSNKFITALPCKEYVRISRDPLSETIATLNGSRVDEADQKKHVGALPETLDGERTETKPKTRKKKQQPKGRRKSVCSGDTTSTSSTPTDRILDRLQKRRSSITTLSYSRSEDSSATDSEDDAASSCSETSSCSSTPSRSRSAKRVSFRNELATFDFSDDIERIERALAEKTVNDCGKAAGTPLEIFALSNDHLTGIVSL